MQEVELKNAINRGDLAEVTRLLQSDLSININFNFDTIGTPLFLAYIKYSTETDLVQKKKFKEMIKCLLTHGANAMIPIPDGRILADILREDHDLAECISSHSTSTTSSTKRIFDLIPTTSPATNKNVPSKRARKSSASDLGKGADADADDASHALTSTSLKHNSPLSATSDTSGSEAYKAEIEKTSDVHFIVPRLFSDNGTFAPSYRAFDLNTVTRSDTHLGNEGQGDHTTAYNVIMDMLFSAIEGENLKDIPDILCELGKCFLAQPDYKILEEIKSTFFKNIQQHIIERDQRKQLTKALRILEKHSKNTDNSATTDDTDSLLAATKIVTSIGESKIKAVIKEHEQLLLLNGISLIGETLVKCHQNDRLAVISKVRVEKTVGRLGGEGTRVSTAMRQLKILNHLLYMKRIVDIENNPDKKEQLLQNYRRIFLRIIKTSKPTITKNETLDRNFNEALQEIELPVVAINKNASSPLEGVNLTWLASINLSNIKLNLMGKLFNDLFDFRFVKHKNPEIIEEDRNDLAKIAAKHIVCIFKAFKFLNSLNESIKLQMIKNFCEVIIKDVSQGGQGWGQCKIANIPYTANQLYDEIKAHIDFNNNNCALIYPTISSALVKTTNS